MSGSAVESILNPTKFEKKKGPSRNHARENRIKLLEAQEQNRRKKEDDEEKAREEPFKMSRFKDVTPMVFEATLAAQSKAPPAKPFLKRASTNTLPTPEPREVVAPRPAKAISKPKVPTAQECAETFVLPREDTSKNFISENALKMVHAQPKFVEMPDDPAKHMEFGKVPTYLLERKAEMQRKEAQRVASLPDPTVPPGMIRLSEEERVRTLEILKQNAQKMIADIQRMPLLIETISQRRRKDEAEAKLKEIESAIEQFSRPVVFVKP